MERAMIRLAAERKEVTAPSAAEQEPVGSHGHANPLALGANRQEVVMKADRI